MSDQQMEPVITANIRVTHTHAFEPPGGICRCGKTEAECDGPVEIREAVAANG